MSAAPFALAAPDLRDPDAVAFNVALVESMRGVGWTFPPASLEQLRDLIRLGPTERSGRARMLTVPASADGPAIPLRVLDSPQPTGVYVHCHPGGWTIGEVDTQDPRLEQIVVATGMTAVSIDYRRAPEHPYPAPLDDCERAARWLLEHAEQELGSARLVIGGESAGANLALCTLLRLTRQHPGGGFAAASLLYGNYDLTMTPSQLAAGEDQMISRRSLEWFYDQYVPDHAQRRDPDVSPLHADLSGLPPTLLSVGSADSLLDDTTFLACRMLAAGVACQLQIVPGGEHAFDGAPVEVCIEGVARIDAFLADAARPD
jgi:acetyl esterase